MGILYSLLPAAARNAVYLPYTPWEVQFFGEFSSSGANHPLSVGSLRSGVWPHGGAPPPEMRWQQLEGWSFHCTDVDTCADSRLCVFVCMRTCAQFSDVQKWPHVIVRWCERERAHSPDFHVLAPAHVYMSDHVAHILDFFNNQGPFSTHSHNLTHIPTFASHPPKTWEAFCCVSCGEICVERSVQHKCWPAPGLLVQIVLDRQQLAGGWKHDRAVELLACNLRFRV